MLISSDKSVYNILFTSRNIESSALQTLSLSFITLPQTVYVSLHSQAPQQQYTVLSFSKAWPHSPTDFFTYTMVLHCGHTFLRHIELIYGIALWAYLSEHLVKDSPSSTEKLQYCVLQVTWSHIYHYVRVTKRYTKRLHVKKMVDLVLDSQ